MKRFFLTSIVCGGLTAALTAQPSALLSGPTRQLWQPADTTYGCCGTDTVQSKEGVPK